MQTFLSREQVRDLDRRAIEEFGVPGMVLMENAGRGAAELLLSLGIHGRVLICCGKGNNGGDGFVIARHLANRGVALRVLLLARPEELAGDALINFRILEAGRYPVHDGTGAIPDILERELVRAEWVVDALFGTGLSGPVRSPYDRVIASINASATRVLAVDIPSGLDCDTGEPLGTAVKARHTATFVGPKRGFAKPAATAWTGQVHVLDIGLPSVLLEP